MNIILQKHNPNLCELYINQFKYVYVKYLHSIFLKIKVIKKPLTFYAEHIIENRWHPQHKEGKVCKKDTSLPEIEII